MKEGSLERPPGAAPAETEAACRDSSSGSKDREAEEGQGEEREGEEEEEEEGEEGEEGEAAANTRGEEAGEIEPAAMELGELDIRLAGRRVAEGFLQEREGSRVSGGWCGAGGVQRVLVHHLHTARPSPPTPAQQLSGIATQVQGGPLVPRTGWRHLGASSGCMLTLSSPPGALPVHTGSHTCRQGSTPWGPATSIAQDLPCPGEGGGSRMLSVTPA